MNLSNPQGAVVDHRMLTALFPRLPFILEPRRD